MPVNNNCFPVSSARSLSLAWLLLVACGATVAQVTFRGRLAVLTQGHTANGGLAAADSVTYHLRVPIAALPAPVTIATLWGAGAVGDPDRETVLGLAFAPGMEPPANTFRSGDLAEVVAMPWPGNTWLNNERRLNVVGFIPIPRNSFYDGPYPVYYSGQPYNFTSITFVVDKLCSMSQNPSISTIDSLTTSFFGPVPTPPPTRPDTRTVMVRFWDSCTGSQIKFCRENNLIVSINIPCSGRRSSDGAPWGAATASGLRCSSHDLFGSAEFAMDQAAQTIGDAARYLRRTLVLPPATNCPWSRKSTMGCEGASGCMTFIKQQVSIWPKTFIHEWGHTFGLNHADSMINLDNQASSTSVIPVGDASCAMGTTDGDYGGVRCFASAAAWKFGFNTPLVTFDKNNVEFTLRRQQFSITLLPSTFTRNNMVQIYNNYMNIPPNQYTNIFIQYRAKLNGDAAMDSQYNGHVLIHRLASAADKRVSDNSVLIANIASGSTFQDPTFGNLKVTFKQVNPANIGADISICVFDTLIESGVMDCCDGLDNDCNGLVDSEDPGCAAYPC